MENKTPDYWMAVGSVDNWNEAFRLGNIWGLEPKRLNLWENVQPNDFLLFYAMRPVAGIIGYGTVKTKFRQTQPLWPQEVERGQVLWPLRFEIDVGYCLPPNRWELEKISSEILRFKAGLSFRKLDSALALDVIAKFKEKREPEVPEPSVHKEIKQKLLEIGNLQNHIAEEEYSFDLGKLDVVWRRVQQSVPTYVFEVHVKGDLYHDLAKLKHAFDLWNSHIFLVGNEADPDRISELTRGSFHEIKRHLKFISLAKVRELHARKRALIDLERELGM